MYIKSQISTLRQYFKTLIAIVLALFFLFSDIYYFGVGRPFDYVGLVLLSVFLFGRNKLFEISFYRMVFLTLVFAPWLTLGAIENNSFLMSLSFVVGMVFVLPVSYSLTEEHNRLHIDRNVQLLILITSTFLYIQTIVYYCTGLFWDLPAQFGSIDSRGLNEAINYFRPSGLFQEPNAYCATTFCLISLCMFQQKRNYWVEIFGMVSIAITESLWGFGAVILLIYMLYGFRKLAFALSVASAIAILVFALAGWDSESLVDRSVTLTRIINIEDDPSRQGRFGSSDNVVNDIYLYIGHGIDSQNFQSIAANGIVFLIYGFGVVFLPIILVATVYLFKPNRNVLISTAFLLTTFPAFAYMYFWCWLGLALGISHQLHIRPLVSSKFSRFV